MLEKLKKDRAFLAFRKKLLDNYKKNSVFNHYYRGVGFASPFFSLTGDIETKLAVGGAMVSGDVTESNSTITIDYHLSDSFDLYYSPNRGIRYNAINMVLDTYLKGVLDYREGMKVEANWSEMITK